MVDPRTILPGPELLPFEPDALPPSDPADLDDDPAEEPTSPDDPGRGGLVDPRPEIPTPPVL